MGISGFRAEKIPSRDFFCYNTDMKQFIVQQFNIPELKGISAKTIEEHLKLYAGYVKHANLIMEHIEELKQDAGKYAYELGELQRRFSFEFCGTRNHEYYFASLEGGSTALTAGGPLHTAITQEFGSFELFLNRFKAVGLTRGIGWAILYYDKKTDRLLTQWVDEQHLGHLTDTSIVLALDMWEHSYLFDYIPSQKKEYIEAFFKNLNWEVIEQNYLQTKQ
jgi:Fe-Mn family superoxide dismutase